MAGRPRRTYRRVADAFDLLCDAGGRLHTVAPDKYLDGTPEDATPDLWQNSLDAMMAACIETEKLLKTLAKRAGLREPDSNLAKYDEQLVTSDPEPTAA